MESIHSFSTDKNREVKELEFLEKSQKMLVECWHNVREELVRFGVTDLPEMPAVEFSMQVQYPLYDMKADVCVLPLFLHHQKISFLHELVHYSAAQRTTETGTVNNTGFLSAHNGCAHAWNEGVTQLLTKRIARSMPDVMDEYALQECAETVEYFHAQLVDTLITSMEEERTYLAYQKKDMRERAHAEEVRNKVHAIQALRGKFSSMYPDSTSAVIHEAQQLDALYAESTEEALLTYAKKSTMLDASKKPIDGYLFCNVS